MQITNKHNLPEELRRAIIKNNRAPKEGIISVTELISPPIIRKLKLKYWDVLEEDVSDRLWALLGTAMHSVLENHVDGDAFGEERLYAEVDGQKITGQSDIFQDEIVSDWKVTSAWSYIYGIKPEWKKQVNIYGWLWQENGFKVKTLRINMLLRDWMTSKATGVGKYPMLPFISVDVVKNKKPTVLKYIKERIRLHNQEELVECTPTERWERKGIRMRCEKYCSVNKFCPFFNKEIAMPEPNIQKAVEIVPASVSGLVSMPKLPKEYMPF